MACVVAVVGASGVVGKEIMRTLERRRFPATRVLALASERSAGKRLAYNGPGNDGGEVALQAISPSAFAGVDIALFSAGAGVSREFAPIAVEQGATVIDNSSAWRMDKDCPLVVAEVNPGALNHRPKGIIANPNCGTMQMMVAIKPLHDAADLQHVVVSTYQAASGKGQAALEELVAQVRAVSEGNPLPTSVFGGPLAMNVTSDWAEGSDDYSEEEIKIIEESRKILGLPSLKVSPTCVRVPVPTGHSESLHLQFRRPLSAGEACRLLRDAPGIELLEGPYAPGRLPQPAHAAGTDPVYVGRVRNDLTVPGALNLWVVADNLRKGAALNAVQLAELVAP